MSITIYYVLLVIGVVFQRANVNAYTSVVRNVVYQIYLKTEPIGLVCPDQKDPFTQSFYEWSNTSMDSPTFYYNSNRLNVVPVSKNYPTFMSLDCKWVNGFGYESNFFILRGINSLREMNDRINCNPNHKACFLKPLKELKVTLTIKEPTLIFLDCRFAVLYKFNTTDYKIDNVIWKKIDNIDDSYAVSDQAKSVTQEYLEYNVILFRSHYNQRKDGKYFVDNSKKLLSRNRANNVIRKRIESLENINNWAGIVMLSITDSSYDGSYECYHPKYQLRRRFVIKWSAPSVKPKFFTGWKPDSLRVIKTPFHVSFECSANNPSTFPFWAIYNYGKKTQLYYSNKEINLIDVDNNNYIIYYAPSYKKVFNKIDNSYHYMPLKPLDYLKGEIVTFLNLTAGDQLNHLEKYMCGAYDSLFNIHYKFLNVDMTHPHVVPYTIPPPVARKPKSSKLHLFILIPVAIFVVCLCSLIFLCVYRKVTWNRAHNKNRAPHIISTTNNTNQSHYHTNTSASSHNTPHTLPNNSKPSTYNYSSHSGSYHGNKNSAQPMLPGHLTTTTIAPVTSSLATVSTGYYPSPRPPQTTPYDSDSTPSPPPPTSILDSSTTPSMTNNNVLQQQQHHYPPLMYHPPQSSSQNSSSSHFSNNKFGTQTTAATTLANPNNSGIMFTA